MFKNYSQKSLSKTLLKMFSSSMENDILPKIKIKIKTMTMLYYL